MNEYLQKLMMIFCLHFGNSFSPSDFFKGLTHFEGGIRRNEPMLYNFAPILIQILGFAMFEQN